MIKNVLLFLWQLPQNILGIIVYLVNIKHVEKTYNSSLNIWYYTAKHINDKCVSLGKFIFVDSDRFMIDLDTIRHERGHQKQSLYLGWLYLIFIGLPSLIGNIIHEFVEFDYYSQPWEKWADKLGNVDRNKGGRL